MLESVVFDFDGVLVNSPEFYIKYTKKYLANLGIPLTKKDVSAIVGHPYSYKLDYLNKTYSLKITKNDFLNAVEQEMKLDMDKKMKNPPNLHNLLSELKENKVQLNVASSNIEKNVVFYLKKFDVDHYFSNIVTLDSGFKPKPAPDVYLETLRRSNKKAINCVAVEDTEIGVISARKAGLRVIAVPNKLTSSQNFSDADLVLKDFRNLNLSVFKSVVL
ncbi:MAG TPA: HAD family phosphatase [archaeon]|nr:HAD family phosphatase [archaeon]